MSRASQELRPIAVAAVAAAFAMTWSGSASAAPKPRSLHQYDYAQLGFNGGEPYKLNAAEAEAVLGDPRAELFAFDSPNWMVKAQSGQFVPVADVVGRFPQRSAGDLVSVYQLDLDGDKTPEMLLVPSPDLVDAQHRYAPTMLTLGPDGYHTLWTAQKLPGERYRVVDVRDLDNDGRPEVLLTGESGQSGAYQFLELVAQAAGREVLTLPVTHVDSLHYVDLDADDTVEIVVRVRVGRRGPARQWTYIDQIHRWDGTKFKRADEQFWRYHDEHTLPTLIGELVDNYDAKRPILEEKLAAIQEVRASRANPPKEPRGFHGRKVRAMRDLKHKKWGSARGRLQALDREFGYDPDVLLGLAEAHAAEQRWEPVLEVAIRALSVDPTDRHAWWWAGVAFSELSERSSAVASFYLLVNLRPPRDQGVQFLLARRAEPGMDAHLQEAIDDALNQLGVKR